MSELVYSWDLIVEQKPDNWQAGRRVIKRLNFADVDEAHRIKDMLDEVFESLDVHDSFNIYIQDAATLNKNATYHDRSAMMQSQIVDLPKELL